MTARVAALAVAAPLLFIAPALADSDKSRRGGATLSINTSNGSLSYSTGHNHYSYDRHDYYRHDRGHQQNRWGQRKKETKRLKRNAARACSRAIRDEAYHRGFRDVDFDDGKRVSQLGPRSFRVRFNEVEFENRRRDIESRVTCVVRRGYVAEIRGIPQRGKHRDSNRRYRY
ncbi:MAG: hypothetical protein Hens3KO_03240 [Henriciella sp.]